MSKKIVLRNSIELGKGALLFGLNLKKVVSKRKIEILKGIDIVINKGELVCIVGASGAGKSTLLHILGTLDQPTEGKLFFKGRNLLNQPDWWLSKFRNQNMGFVSQFHYLFSEFTVEENILIPAQIACLSHRESKKKADELIELVDLKDRKSHYPSELSGGEKQRVSIARALMRDPEILFADEPTGNLDTENSLNVENIFFRLQKEKNLTLLVVTHNRSLASKFFKIFEMKNGLWV